MIVYGIDLVAKQETSLIAFIIYIDKKPRIHVKNR
jgi:hypothetical protein